MQLLNNLILFDHLLAQVSLQILQTTNGEHEVVEVRDNNLSVNDGSLFSSKQNPLLPEFFRFVVLIPKVIQVESSFCHGLRGLIKCVN